MWNNVWQNINIPAQDHDYTVDVNTGFSEFNDLVKGDHRSDTLDPGNIKMSFNHVSTSLWLAANVPDS